MCLFWFFKVSGVPGGAKGRWLGAGKYQFLCIFIGFLSFGEPGWEADKKNILKGSEL